MSDASSNPTPPTLALEPEPRSAIEVFADRVDAARRFAGLLAREGELRGLIGPLELPRLWTRHILNCAVVAPLLRPGRVGDIGSGAGLPGIPLAILRPDVELVLIEPMERRVAWLNEVVSELHLTNVQVVLGRAQDVGISRQLDQVTARAVSALKTLIPLATPLVRPGGELILMKGEGAAREVEAAAQQIKRFKLRNVEILELGNGVLDQVTRVVRAKVD